MNSLPTPVLKRSLQITYQYYKFSFIVYFYLQLCREFGPELIKDENRPIKKTF